MGCHDFVFCYFEGNETFEKLAVMSLIANLVVYLNTRYNMDNATSAYVFNIWSGLINFLPLAGAFVSDAYLGRFGTLLFGTTALLLVKISSHDLPNPENRVDRIIEGNHAILERT